MKIITFRFNEEEYKIKVYKVDWEWHEDTFPIDASIRLERAAEEYAEEAGMVRLA